MASGTIKLDSNNSKLEAKIEWSSVSNGSALNTSTVTGTCYARRTDGYETKGTWTGNMNIGGRVETFNLPSTNIGSNWVSLISFSIIREHYDNGKGECYLSAECHAPSGTSLEGTVASGNEIVKLDTIPRYGTSNQSLNSKTITSIKMNWSSDNIVDYLWYSKDNGVNWIGVDVTDAKSGTYNITGLAPNTTYNIKTRCRRKDSQLTTDSSSLSVTTYDIAKISSANNFNHGDSITVGITNPSGSTTKLRLIVGGTTIFNRNVSAGNNSIGFNDTELDNIYKKYGSGNSVTATFIVDTYNGSTVGWSNSKNVTIYLTGNQKTVNLNVNGIYRRSMLWINAKELNRRAVKWINVNGTWRRGI